MTYLLGEPEPTNKDILDQPPPPTSLGEDSGEWPPPDRDSKKKEKPTYLN